MELRSKYCYTRNPTRITWECLMAHIREDQNLETSNTHPSVLFPPPLYIIYDVLWQWRHHCCQRFLKQKRGRGFCIFSLSLGQEWSQCHQYTHHFLPAIPVISPLVAAQGNHSCSDDVTTAVSVSSSERSPTAKAHHCCQMTSWLRFQNAAFAFFLTTRQAGKCQFSIRAIIIPLLLHASLLFTTPSHNRGGKRQLIIRLISSCCISYRKFKSKIINS